MRVIIMFLLLLFFLIGRTYVIFDLRNFLVDSDQNATFSLLTYLTLTKFSYTQVGNCPDDLISLIE